ncbi:hypothetical protein NC652_040481 [Populus alba x Populus x berolinensis]|nr:hypothetical protein NC652_040481 [Populus alba x Populus x berolinensis]
MSPANSCALLLLFFLTLSLHINFSTADNTNIGVSRRTVAVAAAAAADTVLLQKDVATFLPSDISPPTEKYCYSRLPNTPLPKALGYLTTWLRSLPFSSDKIPEILSYFALQVNSEGAQVIRDEIGGCDQEPNMEGEEKLCATSLESLIDFSVERLGQNVRVLSTDAGKKQEYTVSAKATMIGDHKAAVLQAKTRAPADSKAIEPASDLLAS